MKLRAWDEANKRFGYLNHPFDNNWYTEPSKYGTGEVAFTNNWKDKDITVNDYIIMPYSGFENKNGIEIYKGDILHGVVEYDDGLLCLTEDDYIIATLDEDEGCWVAQDKDGDNIDLLSAYLDYEVVGNIFETPELLER